MWDEVCLTANAQVTFLDEESRGMVKRGTVNPTVESIWNRIDQKYLSSPSEEHDWDNSYKQDHHAMINWKYHYYFQYHRIKHRWSFIKNREAFWRQLHLGKVIHFTSRRKQTAQYMSEFDRGSVSETTEIAITNRTVATFQKCRITIYSSISMIKNILALVKNMHESQMKFPKSEILLKPTQCAWTGIWHILHWIIGLSPQ